MIASVVEDQLCRISQCVNCPLTATTTGECSTVPSSHRSPGAGLVSPGCIIPFVNTEIEIALAAFGLREAVGESGGQGGKLLGTTQRHAPLCPELASWSFGTIARHVARRTELVALTSLWNHLLTTTASPQFNPVFSSLATHQWSSLPLKYPSLMPHPPLQMGQTSPTGRIWMTAMGASRRRSIAVLIHAETVRM